MSDSVLGRLASRRLDLESSSPEEIEASDDLGAFGWLRGVRDRAIMLELRRKDGSVAAFSYAWLERAEFDPSDGITLRFSGKTVRITGRNLNAETRPHVQLFAGLVRHRVPWLQQLDALATIEAPEEATIIEGIELS